MRVEVSSRVAVPKRGDSMKPSKPLSSLLAGLVSVLGLLMMLSSIAFGQHIRGALQGTVNDPNGALVQGASVTLRNVSTGAETTATTDDRGSFNFQKIGRAHV